MPDSPATNPSSFPRKQRSIAAILVGAAVALIGLVLAVGGIWLAMVGGSPYYLITGVVMLVSGVLIARQKVAGAWLYILIVAATILWAFWEVGINGWALVPRIVAPLVLLIAVLLVMPLMTAGQNRWRNALGSVAGVVVLTAVAGLVIAQVNANRATALPLPVGLAGGMGDPALMQVGDDWPAYGGTYSARRYSLLAQITPENAGKLQRAWLVHTGDMPQSPTAAKMYGAETTPLKVGDTLYLCSAKNIMIALDPATGKTKWRYDPRVPDKSIPYTAACRGVSYYAVPNAVATDPCATRIIEGTLDARLIAVDARTGKLCPGFGRNGQVSITDGMGDAYPGMVSITSAPTIVRGVIVTGHQVLDGQDRWAPSGVIQGYDAVTGQIKWGWDMMRPNQTVLQPGQTWTRGTPNMWTTASGDEQLGLVYLPLGNSAADYYSSLRRPLENKYGTSVVALDVTTGKPRWSFQPVYRDVWDYDFGSQATLIDFPTPRGKVPAILLPSKQGDIYVLDRRTGQPLTPIGKVNTPPGGVEPAQRAKTQLVSLYHTLRKPELTERDMWGMSPIDQMACRIQFKEADYRGFFTPPRADKRYVEYPGYNGGSDWGGIAVDPARGLIIANYNDMPNYNRLVPRAKAKKLGWASREQSRGGNMGKGAEGAGDPQVHTPYAISVNAGWRLPATGMLCKQPPYGGIRAIDIRTGKTVWDRPLGTARKNGPFGIPSMLPVNIGTPNNGGAVVTAGGLVFIAAATDDLIRAIDLKTGKVVWSDVLPAGGQATPMTYAVNGKQYVVIMTGGHHFMETPIGDQVIAYALPAG